MIYLVADLIWLIVGLTIYFYGCYFAWKLLLESLPDKTISWGESVMLIILVPLSWITYVGLYLVILGQSQRKNLNQENGREDFTQDIS